MKNTLLALALGALVTAAAAPALAQSSGPPPLPNLTAEQSDMLGQETMRYRQEVDARVARGEVRPDEAQRLVEWRRWQIAQQIGGWVQAGATPMVQQQPYGHAAPSGQQPYGYPPSQDAPPVVVQRQYAYPPPPPPLAYDPWYRPYYYGPRVSVCAGGFGHRAFGSICF